MFKFFRLIFLAAVMCAGAPYLSDPQPANAAQALSGTHRPYPCGKVGNDQCAVAPVYGDDARTVNAEQVTVLSYGKGGTFHNLFLSGIKTVECYQYLGKPTDGDDYACTLQAITLPAAGGWTDCTLDSDGICSPPMAPHTYKIARYGDGTKWVYSFVSSAFQCPTTGGGRTFNGFRFNTETSHADNGSTGTKKCQYSNEVFHGAPGSFWSTCAAAEGATCKFPGLGTFLVRYGNARQQRYFYRLVTGSEIKCKATSFRPDNPAFNGVEPASGQKGCQYLELPTITSIHGGWRLVGMCANCGDVNFNVTSGVERGSTHEQETSFSSEVSASVSVSGGIGGFAETSTQVSASYGEAARNMISDSFSKNESASFTVLCGSGGLWQWVTGVTTQCVAGNNDSCEIDAKSNFFRCLPTSVSPGNEGPLSLLAKSARPTATAPTQPPVTQTANTTPANSPSPPVTTTPPATTPVPRTTGNGGSTTPAANSPRGTTAPTTTATVVPPQDFNVSCNAAWEAKIGSNTAAPKTKVFPLLTQAGGAALEMALASAPPTQLIGKETFMNACVKNGGPKW